MIVGLNGLYRTMENIVRYFAGTVVFMLLGCFPALAYTDLGNNVYQSDGSDSDTQAAVNDIPEGGTVQIPNGTYTWTGNVTIQGKTVHLLGQSSTGVTIHNANTSQEILTVNKSTTGYVEIANLYIDSVVVNTNYSSHLVVLSPDGSAGKPVDRKSVV